MVETVDQQEANKALWIAGGIIVLFVVALFTNGFGFLNEKPKQTEENGGTGEFVKLEIGNAPTLGAVDAPVIIYEFSDFSCPVCAVAAGAADSGRDGWVAPLPALKEKYVDTDKVRIVFKYFPGHGTGNTAHLVGWCMNEQELFWEFHDALFANQDRLSDAYYRALAKELKMNITQFNECINTGKYKKSIADDVELGRTLGIAGTPTFFINGELFAQGYSTKLDAMFEQAIEYIKKL